MKLPWLEDPWNDYAARREQDRLPHALLITGPAGIGKRQLADALVAGLLCEQGRAAACGTCRSCRLLAGGAHPDRFLVTPEDDEREIKIKAIRELISRLVLTTTISPYKVALITPAEAMNRNAANALLKTLEEPPGDALLALVSDDPGGLPATIRSRCQALLVRPPERAVAVDWLAGEHGLDETSAQLALEATSGSPLHAARLAEEGQLETYRGLRQSLEDVVGKPSQAAALASRVAELEPALAWRWLSLAAAAGLRSALNGVATTWPETPYGRLRPDRFARLQVSADRNRKLVATPVRQDLLLQEWLIEWARLPARDTLR